MEIEEIETGDRLGEIALVAREHAAPARALFAELVWRTYEIDRREAGDVFARWHRAWRDETGDGIPSLRARFELATGIPASRALTMIRARLPPV